ncbi:unnamed protein product [Caenorhabditis brenneri]
MDSEYVVTLTGDLIPRVPRPPPVVPPEVQREEVEEQANTSETFHTPPEFPDIPENPEPVQSLPTQSPSTSSIPPAANAAEEWEIIESMRISSEEVADTTITEQIIREATRVPDGNVRYRRSPLEHRGFPTNFHGRGRRCDNDEEEVPVEGWDKLGDQLTELANFLKEEDQKKKSETDPVALYYQKLDDVNTFKIFDTKCDGFKILRTERSEEEQLEIDQSNYEILKFVYSRHTEVVGVVQQMDWDQMETDLWKSIDRFIREYNCSSFRTGALSVAIGFEKVTPQLTYRIIEENTGVKTVLLRPVLIDGVAVLAATHTYDESFKVFSRNDSEMPIYHEVLNLPVKAIFDVIMNFLIRGHKTVVHLPKYYEDYITPGGISKVDDIFAFQRLIDLDYIKFSEVPERRRWFNELCMEVDKIGAVFVSSIEYRRRDLKITYNKASERIITPCFLNTDDRLMIVQPTIRYREKPTDKRFTMIQEKTVLQFPDGADERGPLAEQLYLEKQIESICQLCQLYPMKFLHEVSIKQLLALVVRAESNIEMPRMDLDTYWTLRDKFDPRPIL